MREYVGVIIVKPKPKEHHVEVTDEGFYPGKIHAQEQSRRLTLIPAIRDISDTFEK